jgi:hypothetical protein
LIAGLFNIFGRPISGVAVHVANETKENSSAELEG